MDDYQDDEDAIRQAIAASLNEPGSNPQSSVQDKPMVVDLTADSDSSPASTPVKRPNTKVDTDPDLQRAIKLSLQTQETLLPPSREEKSEPPTNELEETKQPPKDTGSSFSGSVGILGFDRKKQEEERLARLAKKRKAENAALPSSPVRDSKIMKTGPVESGSSAKALPCQEAKDIAVLDESKSTLQFPLGTVKKTWVSRCKRESDIKIEEVFQSSDLELAVLSSFQWDMDWLFSKFKIDKTRFLLIMGAKGDDMKRQLQEETAHMPHIRLCLPSMEGQVNCMHSKLMLLFHPIYLRVVIPSANLVPYDWGEQGGFMENIVFLIDLPRKSDEAPMNDGATSFREELTYFLKASDLNENIIAKMLKFDFSQTEKFAFVHTIGGSHTGTACSRTGHCGLGKAVSSLGLSVSRPLKLDYVTSSVGSLNSQFMRTLYLAAQGDSGPKELALRASKPSSRSKQKEPTDNTECDEWIDKFKVYFPSLKTVQRSRGGTRDAGTICFQSKWYSSSTFPQHTMRNNISAREGVLMHNKMLFVRPEKGNIDQPNDVSCKGWAYVGSANLSESAWGRLVIDRTTKQPKLNCRNWECGVIVPVTQPNPLVSGAEAGKTGKTASDIESNKDNDNLNLVFDDTVPVPMQVPAKKYEAGDRPWFFMED